MTPREIRGIRKSMGMSQKEFAQQLGVRALTVSQWETGFRKPSPLAVRAIEILKEWKSGVKKRTRPEEMLGKRFEKLNAMCFNNEIKNRYRVQLSQRMKRTLGRAFLKERLIRISRNFLEEGDWEGFDRTLKHEMVHCWLYERGMPWGHSKDFKAKLKEIL